MISLIIAIMSIALIVAVVALSGYFGGATITDAQATAQATKLVSEERQILAAMDFFQAQESRWPVDIDELVAAGYLRSVPPGVTLQQQAQSSSLDLISRAYAADSIFGLGWNMPVARTPVILTVKIPKPTCKAYNRISRGDDGILRQAFETLPAQCYGAEGEYKVVVRKTSVVLASVLDPVIEGGLPTKDMAEWWDSEPSVEVTQPVDPAKKPKPEIYLSTSAVDFGTQDVGVTVRSATISVTNRGMQAAQSFSVKVPTGFNLVNSSCGLILQAGASCTFALEFTPSAPQSYSGTLTAGGNAGTTAQLQVSGGGISGDLVLSTDALNFGNVQVAQYRKSSTITLSNRGQGSAKALDVQAPTGFQVVESTCATVLAPAASCSFGLQFSPTVAQAYSGAVAIKAEFGNPVAIHVEGVGVAAGAQLTGIAFGTRDAGAAITQDAVFTNTGIGPLQLGAPTVSGAGFSLGAGSTCGAVLAGGASCLVKVLFTPTGIASHTGVVSVLTQEVGIKQASLTGQSRTTYVVDQTITAVGYNVSIAIPAGVYSITLTGKGGPGGSDYYPAIPAVPATYQWEYLGYSDSGTSTTAPKGCVGLPEYARPSSPPSYDGQTGGGCMTLGRESDGLYHIYQFEYVGVMTSPGSPAEPAYWVDYDGEAGFASVGGTNYTFPGGYAKAATPVTYTKTLDGSAQTLRYTVPSGGSLRYQYSYKRPN